MTDFGFDWHMDLFEGWDTDDLFRHYNHVTGKVREAIANGRPETLERDFEICEAIRTTLHKRGVNYQTLKSQCIDHHFWAELTA